MFLENTLFGAACATGARFPALVPRINALSAAALGDSEAVDASYKIFTARRDVRFLEMEYAIPREHLRTGAARDWRDLIERTGWTITFPVEVRVTPAERRVAVHRVRQADGLSGLPRLPAHAQPRLLRGRSRRS